VRLRITLGILIPSKVFPKGMKSMSFSQGVNGGEKKGGHWTGENRVREREVGKRKVGELVWVDYYKLQPPS
jgi:hypothetical protein